MSKVQDPFVFVLWQATDRFFAQPMDLVPDLTQDPQGTLYKLSSTPEVFGNLDPSLTPERRQERLQQLLDAARAYIVNSRKPIADAVDQGELPLTDAN